MYLKLGNDIIYKEDVIALLSKASLQISFFELLEKYPYDKGNVKEQDIKSYVIYRKDKTTRIHATKSTVDYLKRELEEKKGYYGQ